ncbi:carbohydrate kinase family protein [Methanobrevibacter sp. OttesenSCG-928-K11]|nr:carbohydrate kinase family protein [Methanobrevibacter sp. OttesenSCG-928-K11]MDL2270710.1 carbohydrate kinase family protein [Methanobrevibacter sp. OttesenSCG-928-I08]
MTNKRDLLAVGHTAFDYIMTLNEFPKANNSAPINNMQNLYGGAAANVAIVGATLGLNTSLISAVGNEFLNSRYKKKMDELNINTDSFIIVNNKSTPTAFVLTDENRDQISYFYWGASEEFKNSKIPEKAINESEVIHLATGDPHFNWKCGISAKEQDKIVSFDPGQDLVMYSPEKLKEVIMNTSILFGNHYEIGRILDSLKTDIQGLRELGPKIVIKTCGKEGSEIYSDEDKIKIDAVVSDAVDPTGAGDSYRAGFLTRYINGESIEDSAKFASAVSSFIIGAQGCQTNIPSFDIAYERMIEFYSE